MQTHPRINTRRIAVEMEQDDRLHAELERLGWTLPMWFRFQDTDPDGAARLEGEIRHGGTVGGTESRKPYSMPL